MVLYGLKRSLPALYRMTIRAIGAKLATMNIRVTVGTLRADILENHAGMALIAADVLMHATQGITGQIVIKFWIRTYWFPTRIGVTVSARSGKRAMGIGDLGPGGANPFAYAGTTGTGTT